MSQTTSTPDKPYNEYFIDLLIQCNTGDKESIKEYMALFWDDVTKIITFDEAFINRIIKLSDDDNAFGLEILGLMYTYTNVKYQSFIKKDYIRANSLYEKATHCNVPMGHANLALSYVYGYGVTKDYKKAAELYNIAIEYGDIYAISYLGDLYLNGHNDFERNLSEAIRLYTKAIESGCISAMNSLAQIYAKGAEDSTQKILPDYKKAIDLYEQAISYNDDNAMNSLGYFYLTTKIDGIKHYEKSIKLYKEAIECGNSYAMNGLGYMLEYGYGIEQNIPLAIELYTQSSDNDCLYGSFNLGLLYKKGFKNDKITIKTDYAKAFELFQKAHDDGFKDATRSLANMYLKGHYVKQDLSKAAELLLEINDKDGLTIKITILLNKCTLSDMPNVTKFINDPRIDKIYGDKLPDSIKIFRTVEQYYLSKVEPIIMPPTSSLYWNDN